MNHSCSWMQKLLLLTVACLSPGIVLAQSVGAPATFQPTNPTSTNIIQVTANVPQLCFGLTSPVETTISGNLIRTTISSGGCVGIGPGEDLPLSWAMGPYPPGNYTYEIYYKFSATDVELRSRQTLVIGPAAIPAMSPALLIGLAFALAMIGILGLRSAS
jgi:hypothetical protein